MIQLYNDVSFTISKIVTQSYSTSFSIAVSFLNPENRDAIYSIYGFVRFADEIVDTFHDFDKETLLSEFEDAYYKAHKEGISLNPVLHSFQVTVKKYDIPDELIQSFLSSMKVDLVNNGTYTKPEVDEYIYGSAAAVGLMCLCVFVKGDKTLYNDLQYPAMKLGSAFQKVNFLRDLKNDINDLHRSYFPELEINTFNQVVKNKIIKDIESDFNASLPGIKKLPKNAKLPVLIAYYYYKCLLKKINNTKAEKLISTRISVHGFSKFMLFNKAYLAVKLGLI
jgi:phytoene/squalene synthetase